MALVRNEILNNCEIWQCKDYVTQLVNVFGKGNNMIVECECQADDVFHGIINQERNTPWTFSWALRQRGGEQREGENIFNVFPPETRRENE